MAVHKKTKKRRRRPKTAISSEERERRRIARKHKSDIRTTFVNCGFEHIPTRDQEIEINGRRGELDGIFLYENILTIVEDTTAEKQSDIVEHVRRKHEFCEHLVEHTEELFTVLRRTFHKFRGYMLKMGGYQRQEFKTVFVYCSLNAIENRYKNRYRNIFKFLNYPYLRYFLTLSRTIHKTARFEFLKFLGFELSDIGPQRSGSDFTTYDALLLPETASSFPPGHKLVSFLVDPNMLLERSYVLRSDSWRDTDCLYPRLLSSSKIKSMREYLVKEHRVFVNNIIATLPIDSVIKDENGEPITVVDANKIMPVSIDIPRAFNVIGIIDGQHRLYSYHEGNDKFDKKIDALRQKQHILVTGIVYPSDISEARKQTFEAQLFLEINDKQKRVKGDLKQAIERIINPYSAIAISKAVVAGLATSGPLFGTLEVYFFDKGKIKTTSIVSYGMRHIVALGAEYSLYKVWSNPYKGTIRRRKEILNAYIDYCVSQVNMLVAGFKKVLPEDMWTTDKKISRALTTTTMNGLIFCLRKLIEKRKIGDFDYYRERFSKMKVSFKPADFVYKSSHWKSLGEKLYSQCFE